MKPVRVNFFTAPVQYFKKFLNYKGRSSRSEYWWMMVWSMIFGGAMAGFASITGNLAAYTDNPLRAIMHGNFIVLIIEVLYIIYNIGDFTLTVRRFRDAGLNAWLSLITLIPYVNVMNLDAGYGYNAVYGMVITALFFFMMYVGLRPSIEDTVGYQAKQ
jgi:uncharacterized membrane protein YhaH (DUF805 family)